AGTLASYDEITKQLEATGHGHPPGRRSHVSARKGDSYFVVDVWDSQEAMNRFWESLVPLLKAGVSVAPPQIYAVHNLILAA
ncbi:MAG: hypothetical protein JOY77_08470, partial [Alphaproteobacteria bacterium]|nr:hypothetical protein [Alphaproteobacteria bacterium]